MKCPKEMKNWLNRSYSKYGKRQVHFMLENWERYLAKNKNEYKRHSLNKIDSIDKAVEE